MNTPAISGSVPPHLTRGTVGPTVPAIKDIVFDAGFSSKAEAESGLGHWKIPNPSKPTDS